VFTCDTEMTHILDECKCFERTDSDLIVTKLFVLTRNDCVAIKLPFVFWTRVGPMNHVLHKV